MRRLLLLFAVLGSLLTGVLRGQGSSAPISVTLGPEFVVNSNNTDIRHLPFLAYVNGLAIATYSEHPDVIEYPTTDGMSVSADAGATWTLYTQSSNFYISSVIALPNGSLMATSYITQRVDSLHTSIYYWISVNGGASWMPYVGTLNLATPQSAQNANWGGFLCHRTMMVMSDGSIQGTMYGRYLGDTRNRAVWVKTTDGGINWYVVSTIAYDPTIGSEGFDEPVVVRAADGSLLAVLRIGSASYPLYQTRSLDNGLAWSAPTTLPGIDPTTTFSVDPDLTLMANGTLVLSYGRPTTNLLFAFDGSGYTWDFHVSPVFTASATNYMGTREVAPGKLLMITDNAAGTAIIGKYVTVSQPRPSTPPGPPVIVTAPQDQTVAAGSTITLSVAAATPSGLTYQWFFNGRALSGQTFPMLVLANLTPAQSGLYAVAVTDPSGTVAASAAVNVPGPPAFTAQPGALTVAPGSTVALNAAASGYPAPGYQWSRNGVTLAGATSARLVLANVAAGDAGSYTCVATNANGAATSAATLAVTATANPGRLVNLSVLSNVQGSLSLGFVLGGAGTAGPETLLIRGVGPSIGLGSPFNVPGVLSDPALTVVQQNNHATVAANAGWGITPANVTAVQTADTVTGAFALTDPTNADAALVTPLAPVAGGYSAVVAGKTGDNGSALTEVYDVTGGGYTPASTRLINLSCLTPIPAGGSLSVGFVIGGSTARTVLIRASGPTLATAPFDLTGTMPDPQLTVSSLGSATVLAANAGWAGDPELASAAQAVGAFAFAGTASLDSGALLTLTPNQPYTVAVSSATGQAGSVLVEIYEVP